MDYQHAQTSGTAGVIAIKTPSEAHQAEGPSGCTARRERAEPAEPPLGSGPSRGRPGGPGPACPAWRRSAGSARPRGCRSRCGSASTARPAGSWRCAAPACSCAPSAPPPPPSGWRPTGSSQSARYRPRRRPRALRASGPAGCAPQPVSRCHPGGVPRAGWPRVSPQQPWLAAPGRGGRPQPQGRR